MKNKIRIQRDQNWIILIYSYHYFRNIGTGSPVSVENSVESSLTFTKLLKTKSWLTLRRQISRLMVMDNMCPILWPGKTWKRQSTHRVRFVYGDFSAGSTERMVSLQHWIQWKRLWDRWNFNRNNGRPMNCIRSKEFFNMLCFSLITRMINISNIDRTLSLSSNL